MARRYWSDTIDELSWTGMDIYFLLYEYTDILQSLK